MKLKIAIFVAVLFLAGLLYIDSRPADMTVQRNIDIQAAPEKILAEITDLHKWENWSPWAKLDPEATVTFSGAESGEGSIMSWSGNSEVGVGTMTITAVTKESVAIRLDFEKPMKGTSNSEFKLAEKDGVTNVTWSMTSQNNFIAKAINIIFNCEKMVGDMYEKGLQNMKQLVENKK